MMHKEEEELWKKERKKASKRSRLVIIYQVSWNNTRRDLQKPFSSLRNAVAYRGVREKEGVEEKDWKKKRRKKGEEFSSEFRHPRHVLTLPLKNSAGESCAITSADLVLLRGQVSKIPVAVRASISGVHAFGWSALMLPCNRHPSSPFYNNR